MTSFDCFADNRAEARKSKFCTPNGIAVVLQQVGALSSSSVLITGASGMVGRALRLRLSSLGVGSILAPNRHELDLLDAEHTNAYFSEHRPNFVFHLAAKVGGIGANMADPVGFLDENLRIIANGLAACWRFKVQRTLLLGSSCIYPRECRQPMPESDLLSGPLEPTNEGYAIAKIAGLKLAQAYHRQYGMQVVCPMPCNIYGTGDHFDLQKSHVLSSLVRRFVEASERGQTSIVLWGSGQAKREFIHVDDVVSGVLHLFERCDSPEIVNLGTGSDVSIRALAEMIAKECGYKGEIQWDASRPDGMPRKCLDCNRLNQLGFLPQIDLCTGVRRTIAEFRSLQQRGSFAA